MTNFIDKFSLPVYASLLLAAYSCEKKNAELSVQPLVDTPTDSTIMFGGDEENPLPIGGMDSLYTELEVPSQLTKKRKVFIQLSLDTTGNITETAVVKGLNRAADQEALKAFSTINIQFAPAKINGQPYTTKVIIPVTLDPENQN